MNYHFHDEHSADAVDALALHCAVARGTCTSICVTNHAEALTDGLVWQADPDEMIARFERSAESVREAANQFPELPARGRARVPP